MPNENTLRSRAHRHGLTLIKYRENSRWYWQYGPYAVADADTKGIISYGLDLADVADELNRLR